MKIKKVLSCVLSVMLMGTLVMGCSSKKSSSDNEEITVNIGTQQMPNDEGIAKAKNYFEEELGVKVNVVEFDSGKDVNNALVSGSIDFGLIGSCPVSLALSSDIDIEVIWIHEILGATESLIATNTSKASKVSDLKGKTIATPFASTAHYSLLNALKENGLSESDVSLIDMQPSNIYAAWQRGDIDAAYVWQPTLESMKSDGNVLLTSEDMANAGYPTANLEVVRKDFAKEHKDLVVKYIKAVDKAVELYNSNKEDSIDTIAKALNISNVEAETQMDGSKWLRAEEQLANDYFGTSDAKGAMVDSLYSIAEFLKEQNSITKVPDKSVFEEAVNPSYIEEALK